MRYRIEMNLNYVQLKKGDNLYDNVDLEVEDCVEARYWKENGYPGNPDICALPRATKIEELIELNNIPITGYKEKTARTAPLYERKRQLIKLKKIRYPFPFHSLIEYNLSMVLISSYSSRRNGVTEVARATSLSGKEHETNIISYTDNISSNTLGFSIVGTSGVGKSTAFDLACAKYPKVIKAD